MKGIDFKRFMFEQKIKQSVLAKYLGVSEGYISQVASGKKQLSEENFGKVLNNPYGWDVSMLTETQSRDEVTMVAEQPKEQSTEARLWALVEEQRKDIQTLLGLLKEKEREIKNLRAELDASKKGAA